MQQTSEMYTALTVCKLAQQFRNPYVDEEIIFN